MRQINIFLCGFVLTAVTLGSVKAAEKEKYPTVGDVLKCPKCNAPYDGKPHALDYQQCPKCKSALEKATAYLKKNFKPTMFGLLLDSFYGGFAFMMEGGNEKELAVCTKNCRNMIKPEPDGNFASGDTVGGDWASWKKSMAMYFLTEYSLRYGLTPENKAALIEGAKVATETQEKGGGWFHGRYKTTPYSPDIAIIGCIYYAAFLEMKTLGIDPGPIADQTRTYLEGISDGKTIGYAKGWHGGMGGGGADGFITLGLQGSGNGDDKWDSGLAGWLEKNYMDAAHGHANGEVHYFAMGAALHRLGADYYARFASCQVHRLIDIQKDDGSIPGMAHDTKSETEYFQKAKDDGGSFTATAVLACLIMMERPGVFSPLPSKPAGSISNKDAFKNGTDALAKNDYATAYKNFAQVLPRGDSGELIPEARIQMRKIEALATQKLNELQANEAGLAKLPPDKLGTLDEINAFSEVIHGYEKFEKDFAGTSPVKTAANLREPLRKTLMNKRVKMAYSGKAIPTTTTAPLSMANAASQKEWNDKLLERLKAVLASGGRPRFESKTMGRVTIQSVNASGSMGVGVEGGGQTDVKWSQMQPVDLRMLAVNLAESAGSERDHALAAYYLLAERNVDKAEEHLTRAGNDAAAVRAAFKAEPQ